VDFARRLFPNHPFSVAINMINGDQQPTRPKLQRPSPSTEPERSPKASTLQAAWKNVIEFSQNLLWSPAGTEAREYLYSRGFTDSTLKSI
jgi:DNA primase